MSADAMMDPAAVFGMVFGSARFEEYVGELQMASIATLSQDQPISQQELHVKLRVSDSEFLSGHNCLDAIQQSMLRHGACKQLALWENATSHGSIRAAASEESHLHT